jgi:hypothetical protein
MAVFGVQHSTATRVRGSGDPTLDTRAPLLVYFVGTALISAALGLVIKKHAGLAGALRDLAFSGGAMAFAATQTKALRTSGSHKLITLARFFIGVPITFFGVERFLDPEFAPRVPLKLRTQRACPYTAM